MMTSAIEEVVSESEKATTAFSTEARDTYKKSEIVDIEHSIKPQYTVIDLILIFQPDRKAQVLVSHISLQEILGQLIRSLDISYASLDQLQSSLALESLNMKGIKADLHNINDSDYTRLRDTVNTGLLIVPTKEPVISFDEQGNEVIEYQDSATSELLRTEMEQIEYRRNNKNYGRVDHTPTGSKDILDTVCQVDRLLRTCNVKSSSPMMSVVVTERNEIKSSLRETDSDWASHIMDFASRFR